MVTFEFNTLSGDLSNEFLRQHVCLKMVRHWAFSTLCRNENSREKQPKEEEDDGLRLGTISPLISFATSAWNFELVVPEWLSLFGWWVVADFTSSSLQRECLILLMFHSCKPSSEHVTSHFPYL
ncbi:hypothetical protein SAY86_029487 [Trapa natans]|uniref:Uncharacterized protein n=1 Tax=Trapa natans TaxID=22666 RepID=A0AAN7RG54_TRANT|nr:hypothetical protein SAY86_029487 [Trapa natans]